jgi:hypothetical protein
MRIRAGVIMISSCLNTVHHITRVYGVPGGVSLHEALLEDVDFRLSACTVSVYFSAKLLCAFA